MIGNKSTPPPPAGWPQYDCSGASVLGGGIWFYNSFELTYWRPNQAALGGATLRALIAMIEESDMVGMGELAGVQPRRSSRRGLA